MKKYKACTPEETIVRIRKILADIGIFLKEKSYSHGKNLYNCRLVAINDGLEPLNIGTNGKGRSYEYSLASGYAEFMERLQSMFLFKENEIINFKGKIPFRRNEIWDFDRVWKKYSKDILQSMPFLETYEKAREMLALKYDLTNIKMVRAYSVMQNKVILIPEIIIPSISTGLASGNTPAEAILQGCCEIFERYSLGTIISENLTPPNIPISYFKGTKTEEIINELSENQDLTITIKDGSLGRGFPVAGILVKDKRDGRYNLKFGSEFNQSIAIERSLTELYQTIEKPKTDDISHFDFIDRIDEALNFGKIFTKGFGHFPLSIFATEGSWDFKGINKEWGENERKDLEFCRQLCMQHDSDIYIIDYSYLGFPTYWVIIPALHIQFNNEDLFKKRAEMSIKSLRNKLYKYESPDIQHIIDILRPRAEYAIKYKLEFDLCDFIPAYYNEDLRAISAELFLSVASYQEGDMAEAYKWICLSLENGYKNNAFYNAIADYMYLKRQGNSQKRIIDITSNKYGVGIGLKTAFWLNKPEDTFRNIGFLYHFNPANWEKSPFSHLKEYEYFLNLLYERNNSYNPDYSEVSSLFYC